MTIVLIWIVVLMVALFNATGMRIHLLMWLSIVVVEMSNGSIPDPEIFD